MAAPQFWDPHTGRIAPAECTVEDVGGRKLCSLRLRLGPVRSVFVAGK